MCSLNAVRSPMACALFEHLTLNSIPAFSAGTRPGYADPFAVVAMDELGLDISDHTPRGLETIVDKKFDLIISLSSEAHHHAVELTREMPCELRYWPTIDVTQIDYRDRKHKLDHYRGLRDMLFERIKKEFPVNGAPLV